MATLQTLSLRLAAYEVEKMEGAGVRTCKRRGKRVGDMLKRGERVGRRAGKEREREREERLNSQW